MGYEIRGHRVEKEPTGLKLNLVPPHHKFRCVDHKPPQHAHCYTTVTYPSDRVLPSQYPLPTHVMLKSAASQQPPVQKGCLEFRLSLDY